MIEVEYLIYLKKIQLPEFKLFPSNTFLLRNIYKKFSCFDCIQIKNIESTINHDVKAVEYFFSEQLNKINLSDYKSFIHFGLTSQDINNNSITLSIKNSIEDLIIPLLENILSDLLEKSSTWIHYKMLSHTHGQPAVPLLWVKKLWFFIIEFPNNYNYSKI